LELEATPDVAETFTEAVGEVATTSVVEVAVKELKQISTGSVRMFAMLVGKTTPDWAAMLPT
jgi:ubiquinone biosynthesis protein UbiJ